MQFTVDEIRAACAAAEDWGTYVMAHAYHPKVLPWSIRFSFIGCRPLFLTFF
jgi:imidazolonepropionase-like amidohydrolase